jgi:hypothetical protein
MVRGIVVPGAVDPGTAAHGTIVAGTVVIPGIEAVIGDLTQDSIGDSIGAGMLPGIADPGMTVHGIVDPGVTTGTCLLMGPLMVHGKAISVNTARAMVMDHPMDTDHKVDSVLEVPI